MVFITLLKAIKLNFVVSEVFARDIISKLFIIFLKKLAEFTVSRIVLSCYTTVNGELAPTKN